MPATNLTDRINEIAATSTASVVVEILSQMAAEPSGKRFTKSRAEAHNRWTQLAELATARARAANASPVTRSKRASKSGILVREMPAAPNALGSGAATAPALGTLQ